MIFSLYNYLKIFNNEALFMNNEIEIWKSVKVVKGVDFSGCYEVSTFGNFRSLDRWVVYKNGRKIFYKGKNKNITDGVHGYKVVSFSKDGITKQEFVHRVVLNTFVPNPNPKVYTDVNHIDEDKSNNNLSNLEWATHKDNMNHGTLSQKISETEGTTVVQLSKEGIPLKQWYSINSVIESEGTRFIQELRKNKIVYDKYVWAYLDKYESLTKQDILDIVKEKENKNIITQIDLNGTFIKEYATEDIKEVFDKSKIINCIKNKTYIYNKYLWMTKFEYLNYSQNDIEMITAKAREVIRKNSVHNKKPIVQLDVNGNIINKWDTIKEASKELRIAKRLVSNIAKSKDTNYSNIILLYLSDYENMSMEEINYIVSKNNKSFI